MNSTLTNSTLDVFKTVNIIPELLIYIIIIFFLGLPLNCYVIYLLLSKGQDLKVSVEFTLNHIIAEVFFSFNTPLYALYTHCLYLWLGYLTMFNYRITMCARPCFQCCVCLEQYLAVIHPVTFLKFKPLRYRVACSALVWLYVITLSISTHVLQILPFKIISGMYLIFLAVESFCCAVILKGLRNLGPGDRDPDKGEMSAAKKKAFQIVSINLLTLLIQNLPIAVLFSFEGVMDSFLTATIVSAQINAFAGLLLPVFILYKAGRLSCLRCG